MASLPFHPSKRAGIVAAGTLAVFFIVGGIYFIRTKQAEPKTSSAPATQNIKSGVVVNEAVLNKSNVSSSSVYENWNNFNSSTKYSLKYPNGWYDIRNNSIKQSSHDEMMFSNEKVIYPQAPSANSILVHSSYLPAPDIPDVDKSAFTSPIGNFKIPGMYDPSIIFTKIANLSISGNKAAEYLVDGSSDNKNLNYTIQYDVMKNGNLYYISFSLNKSNLTKYNTQMQQILNSLTIN